MAYKVVCTKCGKPVKVVASNERSWNVKCGCHTDTTFFEGVDYWKIQKSGVIPKSDRQKYCTGCEDNFYNGNNTVGVTVCWNLDKAKVVMKKKVGINDVPPWNHIPIKCLSCYHETGYVMISTEDN